LGRSSETVVWLLMGSRFDAYIARYRDDDVELIVLPASNSEL
jgi:hypothetical protein